MSDRTASVASQAQQQTNYAVRNRDEASRIAAQLDRDADTYKGLLPSTVSWSDFRNAFLVAVQTNWRLLNADRTSLFLALRKAAMAGLMPDGNEGALVIFNDDDDEDDQAKAIAKNDKKAPSVQWMPMVWGLCKLVRNTGNVANIRVKLIYRGERVVITDEDGKESYKHERVIEMGKTLSMGDEDVIGAYAVIQYKDGFWEFEAMSREELDKIERHAKSKKGPWKTWKQRMQAKTVLHRVFRRVEKSPENRRFHEAMLSDDTMTIDGTLGDVDSQIAVEFRGTESASPAKSAAAPKPAAPAKPAPAAPAAKAAPAAPPPPAAAPPAPPPPKEQPKAAQAAPPPDPAPPPAAEPPSDASDIDVWPVDENGEPLDGRPEPMTPAEFAAWFDKNATDKLREENADNIEMCMDIPAAAKILKAAIHRLENPEPIDYKLRDGAVGDMARPMPVPMLGSGNGRVDWPLYRKRITEKINSLHESSDVLMWQEINEPNFVGKPFERMVLKIIEDRLSSLQLAQQNPSLLPPAAEDTETAKQLYQKIINEAQMHKGDEDILAWWEAGKLQTRMGRLKRLNNDLFLQANAVIDEQRLAG